MALPCTIPRGFLAGVVPWQWLLAARRLTLCACACQAKSDKRLLCPVGVLLTFSMPPSQRPRDIDYSRWPAWVAVVIFIAELFCCLCFPRWRKPERLCWWVHCGGRARIFGVRLEIGPRWIFWSIRNGCGDRGVGLPETCAGAFHILSVLGLGRVAYSFLFGLFVVVREVSPMIHWAGSARKPLARAAVERARGTTRGSPCRVTLSGAFFFRTVLYTTAS